MADSSNGWKFKRGLDPGFMDKLEFAAKQGGWFANVLADADLILGIRNNYVNVYRHGQSLFMIKPGGKTGGLHVSTHPKYLLDPDLTRAVTFDGKVFQVGGHKALETEYGPKTLARIKRAADLYSGDEKRGVHAIVRANPNVIDTEVAFNCKGDEETDLVTPRVDLACLAEAEGKIRLCFWEAKLYSNPELRAAGDREAPVVEQVRRYGELIKKHRDQVVQSYCEAAGNLVRIASWAASNRKVGQLVEQAAHGKTVVIDDVPFVGLAIYDYTAADKGSESWKTHIGKLQEGGMIVRCRGDAKDIRL